MSYKSIAAKMIALGVQAQNVCKEHGVNSVRQPLNASLYHRGLAVPFHCQEARGTHCCVSPADGSGTASASPIPQPIPQPIPIPEYPFLRYSLLCLPRRRFRDGVCISHSSTRTCRTQQTVRQERDSALLCGPFFPNTSLQQIAIAHHITI